MARRSAIALAVCLCAAFTTLLDQSALNTAVPVLGTALGAGPAALQWIIAGYSLTFGLALVPMGRLGDAYGRRWFFAGGVALFTAASVVGGLADSPWTVAVARLLQGAGAGTVNPQVYGIIQDLFDGRDRTRALGAYATVGGLAGIAGPLLGGVLLGAAGDDLGWRLVLLLNVPFGLLTVPLAVLFLPRGTAAPRRTPPYRTTLDLPGLVLLAAATLLLLLPFVLPAGQGPPRACWPLAAAATLLLLGWWERRYARAGGTPVLLPSLLGRRGFGLGVLTAMFQFGASLAATLALTLYLQNGLGWSPLRVAATVLPGALGFAVAAAQSWRLVTRFGRRSVVAALAGALLADAAAVVVLHAVPQRGLQAGLAATQLLVGLCGGLVVSPNQALTLAHAPRHTAGLAGGFLQVSQRIAATIAMAAVAGLVLGGSGLSGITGGLIVCIVLLATSAVFAALDLRTAPPAGNTATAVPAEPAPAAR